MPKRKAYPQPFLAAKKVKVQYGSLDRLPWKSVARPVETGLDGDDGILELEEVDNVEIVYEDKDGGKVVKFNVRSSMRPAGMTSNMCVGPGQRCGRRTVTCGTSR